MNKLDCIKAFVDSQAPENEAPRNAAVNAGAAYLLALESLARSDEWLGDLSLVERVVTRLETLEPQSPGERADIAAAYMKIISPNGLRPPVMMDTIRIKISQHEIVELPKRLLMAESSVFHKWINHNADQQIDLSEKGNEATIKDLINYLTTGSADFITAENAIKLLLLAKQFALTELALKCLDKALDPLSTRTNPADAEGQISAEESALRELLAEAIACSISITKPKSGVAHVKLEDACMRRTWNCLKQLHDFIPVTSLELTENRNLDLLLDFVAYNPGLTSLNLGPSVDVTDVYLEELSQNLQKLASFSINSAGILALPASLSDRVKTLDCYGCHAMTELSVPHAEKINCSNCNSLKRVEAPNATLLVCSFCATLSQIDAPNVTKAYYNYCNNLASITSNALELHCNNCDSLNHIEAPNALHIDCFTCNSLVSINAQSVEMLDCNDCSELTDITAPKVLTLDCNGCICLTSVVSLTAKTVDAADCVSLDSIVVPNATALTCSGCPALEKLEAPNALTIDCSDNYALEVILAPKATSLNCSYCPQLVSMNAPNVEFLNCSFDSALRSITTNATMLECINCTGLEDIHAPKVIELHCSDSRMLKMISAPKAETIYCNNNLYLTTIDAPSVRMLDCNNCTYLGEINVPQAATLICYNCDTLASITAANARNVNCGGCPLLTRIDAPKAATLSCGYCQSLTSISTQAVTLFCNDCATLTEIDAPNAASITSNNCPALMRIDAPKAITLECAAALALTRLSAPIATSINCYYCCHLTQIDAPNATTLICGDCHSLADEAKQELFRLVYRNILTSHYTNTGTLVELLALHFKDAQTIFLADDIQNSPLFRWFIDTKQPVIPAEFASEAERLQCKQDLDSMIDGLFSLAASECALQSCDLSWFRELKKLTNLQQQRTRVNWLACMLACSLWSENPLTDPQAIPTLNAIGNHADPLIQAGMTRALLSMYDEEASDQKQRWKLSQKGKPDHLLSLCLLFTRANIKSEVSEELLKGLSVRYYKDYRLLNPILEMTYALSKEHSLAEEYRESILSLVLKVPEKNPKERAAQFAKRIDAYRNEQPKEIAACRDLLLFGRGQELKDISNAKDLLDKHKEACQALFGVKEGLLHLFADTFKSERYPNGLITYAARLQTLPDVEKAVYTELLGKFVNGQLEGEFPNSRYDTAANPHLEKVFKDNRLLLDKWKEPLEINLAAGGRLTRGQKADPHVVIRDLMKLAITNRHLGGDQEKLYPTLTRALQDDSPTNLQATIEKLQKRIDSLRKRSLKEPLEDRKKLMAKLQNREIEIECFKAIDPSSDTPERMECLRALLGKIPDGLEFKHDVQGMLDALDPSKAPKALWTKIEISDYWEDFLLAGTEVNNSCQRIDGNPDLNKCLLAYILDGKNKLMIVRDSNGKIAARSVLRILWSSEKNSPVLFMEQIYKKGVDPDLTDLIISGCVEKAKAMGLPLVAHATSFPTGSPFPGQLDAFGGPAPYEYVDALYGIQKDGKFTIPVSNIIYMPSIGGALGAHLVRERLLGSRPHADGNAQIR